MNFTTRYPVVSLADIATDTQYGTASLSNSLGRGIPVLRMNNISYGGRISLSDLKWVEIKDSDKDKLTVRKGDLLFNRTNSPELVGKTAIWNKDEAFAFAGYLVRVRFDQNKVIPEYVSAFLNSPLGKRMLFAKAKPSNNMSNISASEMLRLSIPLATVKEQRRIVAILSKADDILQRQEEGIRLTKELQRSTFLQMFGDPVNNERLWPMVRVKDAGEVQLGRQRAPKYQTGKHTRSYIRVANVFEDRIDLTDVLSMDFGSSDFATYQLVHGDILLNEGQSTELVGRPAMWRDELLECCFQNTLIRFRACPDKVEPEFALEIFLYYLRKGQFARQSSKTSSVAHLGAARFAEMPFPLPPLKLQKSFADKRRQIHKLHEVRQCQLQSSHQLFGSLVQRAFRGEL